MRKSKNRFFHVPQPTFLFPMETPLWLLCSMLHGWKDCQTPRIRYLSIFNSFRVIRCLSQCVNPKIAFFTYRSPHFCFPWRRPCDYHAICCMDGKTIQCLPNPSQHVSTSGLFDVALKNLGFLGFLKNLKSPNLGFLGFTKRKKT